MERDINIDPEQKCLRGGLGHDVFVATVSATTGSVVGPIVHHAVGSFLNRPSPEPPTPSSVILPTGVHMDEK